MKGDLPALVELLDLFHQAFEPPQDLTVSEWADKYRFLSREDSAEPGRYRTARFEALREIMDATLDPEVEEVVCQKGSQVGWTTLVGNVLGYYMDLEPSPTLIVLPTLSVARAWSKDRLAPMLRDSPRLRDIVVEPKSRQSGNSILHKEFVGGRLTIIGANAPSELASRPIRICLFDEVDRYPLSAGTEGDPIKLASKRQETFWNRKSLKGSTPLVEGLSSIERDYKRSDQRRRFVRCPHCDEFQILRWEQVKWDKDENGKHLPETARYLCEHCGVLWSDAERWSTDLKGEWRATAEFQGVRGYHLSQLYSPWVKLEKIVREFLEAKGNPQLLQVFVNTVLAETWKEQGETVDAESLRDRIEPYDHNELPEDIWSLTAGVDTQDDRLEVEIVGWGDQDESWGVRYEVIYGDPAATQVWLDLGEILFGRYETEDGHVLRVKRTAIDMGGHHGDAVLSFAAQNFRRGVRAIKGQAGPRAIWPTYASRSKDRRKLWIVGVDTAKDAIYGRFKIDDEGPGFCHLPDTYPDEWFDGITPEEVVTRYREGRPYRVWVLPKGKRNEPLDCRVYAYAARASLKRLKRPGRPAPADKDQESLPGTTPGTRDKQNASGRRRGFAHRY